MSVTSQATTFIYGLCDPITQQLRYVGKSNNPEIRKYEHISSRFLKSKTHKNHWIKGLMDRGERPELFVIEEVALDGWQEKEQFWIAYFKYIGANLTNSTVGGEGDCGIDGRKKQAESLRGRIVIRTAEHTQKLVDANKLKASNPVWLQKISIAAKERAKREHAELMKRLNVAWFAPRTKRYELICIGCGESFVANNTRKKYCKKQCAINTWKRNNRVKH